MTTLSWTASSTCHAGSEGSELSKAQQDTGRVDEAAIQPRYLPQELASKDRHCLLYHCKLLTGLLYCPSFRDSVAMGCISLMCYFHHMSICKMGMASSAKLKHQYKSPLPVVSRKQDVSPQMLAIAMPDSRF